MDSTPTLDTALVLTKDQETFSRFLDGYAHARGAELAPKLQDYMLGELLPFLEDITIVEVGKPYQIVYRLCGTKVIKRIGHEVTGKNLLDLYPPDTHDLVYADIKAMVTIPCGNYSRYHVFYSSGCTVEAETISLPVQSETDANFLLSLHCVEEVEIDAPAQGETQIGTSWSQSFFIDIGNTVPGQTSLDELLARRGKEGSA